MKKAILYIRVSTDEQADRGYSLRDQREKLTKYCELNNIEVLKVFEEDYSAKTFNRPEYKRLYKFCKENKKNLDLMIFTKWDRFSRNAGESYHQINQFQSLGITPLAIEQPLDLTIPEQLLMLAVYLSVPEVENKRRSLNVISGMRRSAKEGRYVGATPRGYKSIPDERGKPKLMPNELAPSIKKSFELMATGRYSQSEVREKLSKKGVVISRSQFSVLLRNPIYMGYVLVKSYKEEQEELVLGIHTPIITEDLFYKVQDVIDKRVNVQLAYKTTSIEMYPLRGLVECYKCKRKLTASSAKGNGGIYYYYHCSDGCKNIIPAKTIHKEIDTILSNLRVDNTIQELYSKMFDEELLNQTKTLKETNSKHENEKLELETKLVKTQNLFIDGNLTKEDYDQITLRIKKELSKLNTSNQSIIKIDKPLLTSNLKWGLGFAKNLHSYYKNSKIEGKRLIIGLMFPQNFTFKNFELQTTEIEKTFLILFNGSKGFNRIKKRDNSNKLELSRLVNQLNSCK